MPLPAKRVTKAIELTVHFSKPIALSGNGGRFWYLFEKAVYSRSFQSILRVMSAKFDLLSFPHFSDPRGETTPLELPKALPFALKRLYFVTANEGQTRGGHSHFYEEEVFIALGGCITAKVHDGEAWTEIVLDTPQKGLYVKTGCWHEFYSFDEKATLLCLSSTNYMPGPENYETDFTDFLKASSDS